MKKSVAITLGAAGLLAASNSYAEAKFGAAYAFSVMNASYSDDDGVAGYKDKSTTAFVGNMAKIKFVGDMSKNVKLHGRWKIHTNSTSQTRAGYSDDIELFYADWMLTDALSLQLGRQAKWGAGNEWNYAPAALYGASMYYNGNPLSSTSSLALGSSSIATYSDGLGLTYALGDHTLAFQVLNNAAAESTTGLSAADTYGFGDMRMVAYGMFAFGPVSFDVSYEIDPRVSYQGTDSAGDAVEDDASATTYAQLGVKYAQDGISAELDYYMATEGTGKFVSCSTDATTSTTTCAKATEASKESTLTSIVAKASYKVGQYKPFLKLASETGAYDGTDMVTGSIIAAGAEYFPNPEEPLRVGLAYVSRTASYTKDAALATDDNGAAKATDVGSSSVIVRMIGGF